MDIALGIDTGGTYTDAALVDQENGKVLAKTKALTTHRDLAIGIGEAIRSVFQPSARLDGHAEKEITPEQVGLVGLSTTLATNAIVEGQGSPVCLILIGYDEDFIQRRDFSEELVTPDVVYIRGGHNGDGDELAPLDIEAAQEAILAHKDTTAAFAISGYFGVRNPEHELQVKTLVEALTEDARGLPLPVTCGHELTTKLNAIRRATTAALNARLIPVLRDLILTVQAILEEASIGAPLMIVKGDGSLVRAAWAIQRPIETILSGPAASVVGAWHVAGRKDVWVVDVGGTTTDIAVLRDGHPRLNPQGAQVGRWRTMVEAADVHTVGLGGDSHVRLSPNGYAARHPRERITVGPQRVLPLCRLGSEYPEILTVLREQQAIKKRTLLPWVGQFLIPRRPAGAGLAESDRTLVTMLADGPVALVDLAQDDVWGSFLVDRVQRLVAQQVAMRVGFTPTDALHVLGRFELWSAEAAQLGAALLARQLAMTAEVFCGHVAVVVSDRVATELVTKVLSDEIAPANWQRELIASGLLARALNHVDETDLACRFQLRQPVVAVGAPVSAYMPRAVEQLNTELVLPEHAGVANAIGAVVGSVVQRATVLIRPIEFGEFYRVHLPGNLGLDGAGMQDFESIEDSIAYAHEVVPPRLHALTMEAGAQHVELRADRSDHTGPIAEKIDNSVFLESTLTFTAVGRPARTKV